ncbi:MAG TPA: hypothetical protein PK280_12685 [Planctomycetota bacterium]|nr:hypothetical protein [Planctomycetota bacterium]
MSEDVNAGAAPAGRSRRALVLGLSLGLIAALAAAVGTWLLVRDRLGGGAGGSLDECLAALEANPDDAELRERIAKLGARSGRPVPEEARRHLAAAREIFESAGDITAVGAAIEKYQAAVALAPWWSEANRDLGLALEAAQRFEEARAALRLALAAGPPAADARAIEEDVRRVEAALTRAEAEAPPPDVACELVVPNVSADYWTYLDGRLLSPPPHEKRTSAFTAIAMLDGWEAWDERGLAVKGDSRGRLTFVRGDLQEKLYDTEVVFLEPGTHRIELLLLNTDGFPLACSSRDVEISAGKPEIVRLDLPAGFRFGPNPRPATAELYSTDWQALFNRRQARLKDRMTALAADPVARALNEALAGLRLAAPERPVLMVDLPAERGGPRELDARLVGALVGYLRNEYQVYEALASAEAGSPADFREALARLLPLIQAHNARIAALEEIVRILDKVKVDAAEE